VTGFIFAPRHWMPGELITLVMHHQPTSRINLWIRHVAHSSVII